MQEAHLPLDLDDHGWGDFAARRGCVCVDPDDYDTSAGITRGGGGAVVVFVVVGRGTKERQYRMNS